MSWSDFERAPLHYLRTRGRLFRRILAMLRQTRDRVRPRSSWPELIDFAFDAADGFLRPLQVRSEIQQALEEMEKLRPRVLMEIGTALGGTFFLLSRAAASDARLVSLDLPHGRFGGGYSSWKTWIFRRLLLPHQTATFIRSDSHAPSSLERVREVLGGVPLDMLFIDGDHSYEGVKADFALYAGLVRPGGLIVMHDIAKHQTQSTCHVDQFWAEVKPRFRYREIIENREQGWAGVGLLWNEPSGELVEPNREPGPTLRAAPRFNLPG